MHCYTLRIGGVPERGIQLSMTPGHPVPVVVVGPQENGAVVPVDKAWFDHWSNLQQMALQLPECKGRTLGLPKLAHCELEGETLQNYKLVSRPGDEEDRRVLVRLMPPEGEKVRYTGSYKIESLNEQTNRVVRSYPRLDDVVGIEHIAGYDESEALIIMYPGAAFRVTRPRGSKPDFHMYKLTSSGSKPRIIDLTPRRDGGEFRAA